MSKIVNLPTPAPAPEPDPKPETDLDVTTSTDDKIVLLLDELIREQRKTVSQANIISHALDRIRGHLVFYTVLMVLGVVGAAGVVGPTVVPTVVGIASEGRIGSQSNG